MKYAGFLLILLAAFFVSEEYRRRVKRRVAECRDFLAFLSHMRVQVGCFLKPTKQLGEGFHSESLSEAGFIDALAVSDSIGQAFSACESRLSLSRDEKETLSLFFSSFGEGYLDGQIKLIDAANAKMESLYASLASESVKNTRLVMAISVTAAIGLIIFVI